MIDKYPDGYNANGLAPVIYIYDQNLRLRYTYQHPQIIDPATQDFTLLDWQISGGINSNAGSCAITIEDHDDNFTDDSGRTIIKTGWHIQILLGKDAQTLESWFFGVINEPGLTRPGFSQQILPISAYGYSNTLASRFITFAHNQARNAEGELDNTDMKACISELVKRVFAESSLLIPPPDPNLTLNGIDEIDIKLASFDKQNQSQGIVISELANVANAAYGVTPDLDFFFHGIGKHGGFTITNGDATNIDPNKLMIIRNKPYTYKETSVRKAFTSLIGLDISTIGDKIADTGGTDERILEQNYNYYGFEIPSVSTDQLQVRVKRHAEYTDGIAYEIRHYAGSTDDNLSSNSGDLIIQDTITAETLNKLPLNQETWLNLELNLGDYSGHRFIWFIAPNSALRVLQKYNNNWSSFISEFSRGATDTNENQQLRIRIREKQQVLLKAQNLAIQRTQQHKEQVQYLASTPESESASTIFEGLLDQAGLTRRIFANIPVSVPTTRPPLGQQFRFIDTHNNLDTNPLLIGYDISAGRETNLAAIDMTLEGEQYE